MFLLLVIGLLVYSELGYILLNLIKGNNISNCEEIKDLNQNEILLKGYTKIDTIKIEAGDFITLQTKIDKSSIWPGIFLGFFLGEFGPEGKKRGILSTSLEDYNIVREYPHCSLLSKISNDHNWRYSGKEDRFIADSSGFLELEINDKFKNDNIGCFIVQVNIIKGGKQ
jgi:hypothetical protein